MRQLSTHLLRAGLVTDGDLLVVAARHQIWANDTSLRANAMMLVVQNRRQHAHARPHHSGLKTKQRGLPARPQQGNLHFITGVVISSPARPQHGVVAADGGGHHGGLEGGVAEGVTAVGRKSLGSGVWWMK